MLILPETAQTDTNVFRISMAQLEMAREFVHVPFETSDLNELNAAFTFTSFVLRWNDIMFERNILAARQTSFSEAWSRSILTERGLRRLGFDLVADGLSDFHRFCERVVADEKSLHYRAADNPWQKPRKFAPSPNIIAKADRSHPNWMAENADIYVSEAVSTERERRIADVSALSSNLGEDELVAARLRLLDASFVPELEFKSHWIDAIIASEEYKKRLAAEDVFTTTDRFFDQFQPFMSKLADLGFVLKFRLWDERAIRKAVTMATDRGPIELSGDPFQDPVKIFDVDRGVYLVDETIPFEKRKVRSARINEASKFLTRDIENYWTLYLKQKHSPMKVFFLGLFHPKLHWRYGVIRGALGAKSEMFATALTHFALPLCLLGFFAARGSFEGLFQRTLDASLWLEVALKFGLVACAMSALLAAIANSFLFIGLLWGAGMRLARHPLSEANAKFRD